MFSVPPRVVAREPEVSARAGAGAELECVAHGNPAPSIRWRRLRDNQVSVCQERITCIIAQILWSQHLECALWGIMKFYFFSSE